ncbi:MAG TPA: ParA family protein [Ktedonobacterales bacterium]|nr:ParA family protein [Ktedonobacterales bacterium]
MKTIAVLSQKGGTGKTTLAVHLATASTLAGRVAAIIDLDPQATAASWGDRRQMEAPEVVSGQAARLPQLMHLAQTRGADILFVDTAPNADQAAAHAARAANIILVPCRPAAFDLEAIETTLMLAKTAGKPAYVVLNAVPPRSSIADEAEQGLTARGTLVCPCRLAHRAAFTHGVIDGRTAQEFDPQGKAAQEVAELYKWLRRVS